MAKYFTLFQENEMAKWQWKWKLRDAFDPREKRIIGIWKYSHKIDPLYQGRLQRHGLKQKLKSLSWVRGCAEIAHFFTRFSYPDVKSVSKLWTSTLQSFVTSRIFEVEVLFKLFQTGFEKGQLRLLFVERFFPQIFFRVRETIIYDLLQPKSKNFTA